MERPNQPRDRIRWRGERTTIERTRIATPHSSWIESSTETESTAIDELSLSPPAAADETPPTERSGISNQRTQPSDSPWPGKERNERDSHRAQQATRHELIIQSKRKVFAPATPKTRFSHWEPARRAGVFRPSNDQIRKFVQSQSPNQNRPLYIMLKFLLNRRDRRKLYRYIYSFIYSLEIHRNYWPQSPCWLTEYQLENFMSS